MNDPTEKSTGETVIEGGKERLSQLSGAARSRVVEQANERKSQLSQGLSSLSEQLRQGGNSDNALAGGLLSRGADYAKRAADALDQRSAEQLMDDVKTQLRERPVLVLGAFFAAGFLASRLLR